MKGRYVWFAISAEGPVGVSLTPVVIQFVL